MRLNAYYKARVNGRECIIQFQGSVGPSNHCATCTCYNDKVVFVVVSDNKDLIPVGNYTDVQVFEEVRGPY